MFSNSTTILYVIVARTTESSICYIRCVSCPRQRSTTSSCIYKKMNEDYFEVAIIYVSPYVKNIFFAGIKNFFTPTFYIFPRLLVFVITAHMSIFYVRPLAGDSKWVNHIACRAQKTNICMKTSLIGVTEALSCIPLVYFNNWSALYFILPLVYFNNWSALQLYPTSRVL